jgi:hypothetical protein
METNYKRYGESTTRREKGDAPESRMVAALVVAEHFNP